MVGLVVLTMDLFCRTCTACVCKKHRMRVSMVFSSSILMLLLMMMHAHLFLLDALGVAAAGFEEDDALCRVE